MAGVGGGGAAARDGAVCRVRPRLDPGLFDVRADCGGEHRHRPSGGRHAGLVGGPRRLSHQLLAAGPSQREHSSQHVPEPRPDSGERALLLAAPGARELSRGRLLAHRPVLLPGQLGSDERGRGRGRVGSGERGCGRRDRRSLSHRRLSACEWLVLCRPAGGLARPFEHRRGQEAPELFCARLLEDRHRVSAGGQRPHHRSGRPPRALRVKRDSGVGHAHRARRLQRPGGRADDGLHVASEPGGLPGPGALLPGADLRSPLRSRPHGDERRGA